MKHPAPVPPETEPAAARASDAAGGLISLVDFIDNLLDGQALLKEVHAQHKTIDAQRVHLKAPSLETGKRIDEFFRPALNALEGAKKAIKAKMDAWVAAEYATKQAALEAAKSTAQVEKALAVPITPVKTREFRVITVVDVSLLPTHLLLPNMKAITAEVDDGTIPFGVEVTYERRTTA